jgi:hypothetical protein
MTVFLLGVLFGAGSTAGVLWVWLTAPHDDRWSPYADALHELSDRG